ncbi:MAG: hypothetical protein WB764_28585 [Xanthobacteraceae bacterium]
MMVKQLSVALMGLGLGLLLGSCGPVAGFTADHWPHWAGGMPEGIPPRPGTPGYDDYVAHRQAETEPAKPAATATTTATANAPAAPAPAATEPHSDDDRPVTRGGLY